MLAAVANWRRFGHDSVMNIPSSLTDFYRFCADFCTSFSRRQDALFELTNAALTTGLAPSLAHLSREGTHRRG